MNTTDALKTIFIKDAEIQISKIHNIKYLNKNHFIMKKNLFQIEKCKKVLEVTIINISSILI